jgi:predicted HD phosphohydrolase
MGRALGMNSSLTVSNNKDIAEWAAQQALSLLSPLGNRWKHTLGVVERACRVGKIFDDNDRRFLIAAAYLHDIGYAPALKKTGYHSIDGAYYLLSHNQQRLASLVAHHFEAHTVAQRLGLVSELDKFPRERSAIADALDYCDITSDSTGKPVSFQERMNDIFQRYNDNHIIAHATRQAMPALQAAYKRTWQALYSHKLVNYQG